MASSLWKFIKSKVGGGASSASSDKSKLADLFSLTKGAQHGFPECPTALDYDAHLDLLAIATARGTVKVFGAPGVDLMYVSEKSRPISHLHFVPNQGRLVVVYEDAGLALLEVNTKEGVSILENVAFLNEGVADVGAVAVVKSGVDAWMLLVGSKGGDLTCIDLPALTVSGGEKIDLKKLVLESESEIVPVEKREVLGGVVAIAQSPLDAEQILVGLAHGTVVQLNLATRALVRLYHLEQGLTHLTWKADGESFVTAYDDGSYLTNYTQQVESTEKPIVFYGPFPCAKIHKIVVTSGASDGKNVGMVVFGGGLPSERYADHHTITVQCGEKHTALDFPTDIVDFLVLTSVDGVAHTLVVLLKDQWVTVDLTSDKCPEMHAPYLLNLHAPITAFHIYSDVSTELIQQLQEVGNKPTDKRPFGAYTPKYSQREWPVAGGVSLTVDAPFPNDLLITAHGDGCMRFWHVMNSSIRLLHKLDAPSRYYVDMTSSGDFAEDSLDGLWPPFRKYGVRSDVVVDARLQIVEFEFDPVSRVLAVGGMAGQVIVYKFSNDYGVVSFQTLEASLVGEEYEYVWRGTQALESRVGNLDTFAGFQGQLHVQLDPPSQITALQLNAEWNLLAVGTGHGFVLVDIGQKTLITTHCTMLLPNGMESSSKTMQQRLEGAGDTIRRSLRRLPRPALNMTFPRSQTYSMQQSPQEGSSTPTKNKSNIPTSITTDGIVEHTSPTSHNVRSVSIMPALSEHDGLKSVEKKTTSTVVDENGQQSVVFVHDKVVLEKGESSLNLINGHGSSISREKEAEASVQVHQELDKENAPKEQEPVMRVPTPSARKESLNEVVVSFESEILPPKSAAAEERLQHTVTTTQLPTTNGTTSSTQAEHVELDTLDSAKETAAAEKAEDKETLTGESKTEKSYDFTPTTVRTLLLTNSFLNNDVVSVACLWVGLNNGRILAYTLDLPTPETVSFEPVRAHLAKEVHLRHGAPVIFLAMTECPLPASTGRKSTTNTPTSPGGMAEGREIVVEIQMESAPPGALLLEPRSPTPSSSTLQRSQSTPSGVHKLLVVSEEQIKIFELPSLKPFGKRKLPHAKFTRAAVSQMQGSITTAPYSTSCVSIGKDACITTLNSKAEVEVFSLPLLKRLHRQTVVDNKENLALEFNQRGQGLFLSGAKEFERFSLLKDDTHQHRCLIELPEGARPVVVVVEESPEVVQPVNPAAIIVDEKEMKDLLDAQTEHATAAPDTVETITLQDAAAPVTAVVEVVENVLVVENEQTHRVEEIVVVKTTTVTTVMEESTGLQSVEETGGGDQGAIKQVVIEETTVLVPAEKMDMEAMEDAEEENVGDITSDTIVDHSAVESKVLNGHSGDGDEHNNGNGNGNVGEGVHSLKEKLRELEADIEAQTN